MLRYELKKICFTKRNYLVLLIFALLYLGLILYTDRFFIGGADAEMTKEMCIKINAERSETINSILSGQSSDMVTRYYYQEDNNHIVNRSIASLFIKNMVFGVVVSICAIFIICSSFSVEYKTGMYMLTKVTSKGHSNVNYIKYISGVLTAVALTIFFTAECLIANCIILRLDKSFFTCPLYLVDGYELCASGLTLTDYFIFQFAMTLLIALLTATVTMFFSKLVQKAPFAVFGSMVFVLSGVAVDLLNEYIYSNEFDTGSFRLMSVVTFNKLYESTKAINPYALLNVGYYLEKPRFTFVGEYAWTNWTFPMVVTLLLVGIMSIYILHEKRIVTDRK